MSQEWALNCRFSHAELDASLAFCSDYLLALNLDGVDDAVPLDSPSLCRKH